MMVRCRTIGVALLLLATGNARADKPLWEAGAGFAVVDFATYRGSDQYKSYLLPVPYFVYRGKFLKVDRQRVRGLLFRSKRVELDLSLNGTVPVRGKDNPVRKSMPNLDPTLELGPSFNIRLWKSQDGDRRLDLRLPLRYAIASNFSRIYGVGWLFQPQINLDVRNIPRMPDWHLGMLTGPIFATASYHQYFYGVAPQYATSWRPAYRARGGYAGMQFIVALSKRYPKYWVGAFVKFDDINGAVFANSPLVRAKTNLSGGVAITWIFARSEVMVHDDD